MNTDLLLTRDGDLHVGETGDISLTGSARQAIAVRLRWFLGEWRYDAGAGVPYFDEMFVKNPDAARIRQAVSDEASGVGGVTGVRDIRITMDRQARTASVALLVATTEGTYREEVAIDGQLRGHPARG